MVDDLQEQKDPAGIMNTSFNQQVQCTMAIQVDFLE